VRCRSARLPATPPPRIALRWTLLHFASAMRSHPSRSGITLRLSQTVAFWCLIATPWVRCRGRQGIRHGLNVGCAHGGRAWWQRIDANCLQLGVDDTALQPPTTLKNTQCYERCQPASGRCSGCQLQNICCHDQLCCGVLHTGIKRMTPWECTCWVE
jgi:hypothetical protein